MADGKLTAKERKAEERRLSVEEAAGPELPLPVMVGRDGVPRPITPYQAFMWLRVVQSLTVDVEHSGYPLGHQNYWLRTVQLGDDDAAVVFDPADPEQAAYIRALLATASRLIAHSVSADLAPLEYAGLCDFSAWERAYDTVIPAKIASVEYNGEEGGLKELAGQLLDDPVSPAAEKARKTYFSKARWLMQTKVDTPLERSGWAQCDYGRKTMQVYAASDVLDTGALDRMLPNVRRTVLERERAAQRITAKVTHAGLLLDKDHVQKKHAEHTERRDALRERITDRFEVENPGSTQQLAARLIELGAELPVSDKGNPSTAGAVCNNLRHDYEGDVADLAELVVQWRHSNTAITLLLEPYRQAALYGDGRVRPFIYTLNADTGRMSCSRPNLQQVSRSGGIRACIVADSGWSLIAADLSNIEVRVAAALSGDSNLIRMLENGLNLHKLIAQQVWGPDFTEDQKYVVKRGVFGRLYGGGYETLAAQVGVPIRVIKEVCKTLDDMAPELKEWSEFMRAEVRGGTRQMQTYSGRVIHLPPAFPHKAPNYAIQGTARELLVDGLIQWDKTKYGGGIVLPIHDEILALVRTEHADDAVKTLAECMTTEFKGIPILAEADAPMERWEDAS